MARCSQLQTAMDMLGYAFVAASCLFLGLISVAPTQKRDTDMLGRIAIVAVWCALVVGFVIAGLA